MDRRTYLATAVASTALAGCSTIQNRLSGPKYTDVSKEDLLLSVSDFPDGWARNDQLNEEFDAVFHNEDETIFVLLSVHIYDEISGAADEFESVRNGHRDPQDLGFADEAFWDTRNGEIAVTAFRDSNAIGSALAASQSGFEISPEQVRSQNYAEKMYQHWQDL